MAQSPVIWFVQYQDGTSTHSGEGPWINQAQSVFHQQELLFMANKPIAWIEFRAKANGEGALFPLSDFRQGIWRYPFHHLDIPHEALAVFAHSRYAAPITEQSESIWIYTCFGYLTPTQELRWELTHKQSTVRSMLRPHVEGE